MESAPYPGFVDSTRSITWRTSANERTPVVIVDSQQDSSILPHPHTPLFPLLNAFTTSIKQSRIGWIKWEKACKKVYNVVPLLVTKKKTNLLKIYD